MRPLPSAGGMLRLAHHLPALEARQTLRTTTTGAVFCPLPSLDRRALAAPLDEDAILKMDVLLDSSLS